MQDSLCEETKFGKLWGVSPHLSVIILKPDEYNHHTVDAISRRLNA